jgi:hypothetical protein
MRSPGKTRRAWVLAACLMSLGAGRADAGGKPAIGQVRLYSPYSTTVDRALQGAQRRLARPGCQRIFSDFQDADGRPLREGLERLGTTVEEFIGGLLFYDGSLADRCQQGRTLAYTFPGSRVVFVCAAEFARSARHDPFLSEAALIHESLHSLGLGENPPTSAAITARVMSRCRQ